MNTRLTSILVVALAAATVVAGSPSNDFGIVIHLQSNGRVQMLVSAESQRHLTGMWTTNAPLRNAHITIYADRDVPHTSVRNMMNTLSRSGVTSLRYSSSTGEIPDISAFVHTDPIVVREELLPDATNVVRIAESGILFNGAVSSSRQITEWIAADPSRRNQFFLLKCAPGARHDSLVEILDALAASKCTKISIVAERNANNLQDPIDEPAQGADPSKGQN